ncbi:zinc finger protein 14 [Danaus plexippus plexippus]|uniref:Zinc finger protein 14 n=1 Tax=Danaus plexippus plexippus TaxID=278856 RepID=A0A212F918_DANPL|nr:zinc finger protein 14 [Danaus plexippus plexippus]
MEVEEYSIDEDTVCAVCQAEFLDVVDLQTHISQYHVSSRSNYCPFCMQAFPDLEGFAFHMRNEHFDSLLYCKYCTRFFIDEEVLGDHEAKHQYSELNNKVCCSQCQFVFDEICQVESHEFTEHRFRDDSVMLQDAHPLLSSHLNMNVKLFIRALCDNLLFDCIQCGFSTFDRTLFIQHLKLENKQCYVCDTCCNVYKTKDVLSKHCNTHISTLNPRKTSVPNQCRRCKKILTGTNMKNHHKTCVDMKCSTCNLSFDSVTDYAEHAASHSSEKTVPLQICKYCQRPLVGADVLEKHIQRQHKHELHLYKYHCKSCDKIFKHPKLLFGHFFSQHRDIKPYICNICNISFRMRKNFTIHIKLDHKSVGSVEFDDQFYVHFTEKKSDKNKENMDGEEPERNEELQKNVEELERCEEAAKRIGEDTKRNDKVTDDEIVAGNKKSRDIEVTVEEVKNEGGEGHDATRRDQNTADRVEKTDEDGDGRSEAVDTVPVEDTQQRGKYRVTASEEKEDTRKLKRYRVSDSDDSDAPLMTVMKRKTIKQRRKRTKKNASNKFTCGQCGRNCYTFQNYHRHVALHKKNEIKTCIKCHKAFRHQSQLERHIKKQHASSKLTETLKKVMERKNNDAKTGEERNKTREDGVEEDGRGRGRSETEKVELIRAKTFRSTMRRVELERPSTPVTITPVTTTPPQDDTLSAKKFIESFMPEKQESSITISSCLTIKRVAGDRRPASITLTKYTPEPEFLMRPRLRMPVKFKDEHTQAHDVTIRVVNKEVRSGFQLNSSRFHEPEPRSASDDVPGVGEEILLEGERSHRSVVINDVLASDGIKIGHLWPQAPPYYRIVKINEVEQTPEPEEVEEFVESDLTLPNGTKLVNVNPLSHLLGDRQLRDIRRARTRYYHPKVKNIAQTLAEALMKLDKTRYQLRKEHKKNTRGQAPEKT